MRTHDDDKKLIGKTFDYIIVGSGPSGIGVLYGFLEKLSLVLSQNQYSPQLSIAIVERGYGPPHDNTTHSPKRWYEAANPNGKVSNSVRLYTSEITGRTLDIPVGQGLGGTSNVNACLCLPPLQRDLHSWPEPFRSSLRLSAEHLLGVMEENKAIQHSVMGNIHNPFSTNNSILRFHSTLTTTVGRDVGNTFVRRNYYDALLEPLLKAHPHLKKMLHWFRGFEAQRLLMEDDSKRVIGIEYISASGDRASTYQEIYAKNRVILCAGAIETPALLLVSKLGDKEPLRGIGQNLRDQALLARVHIKPPSLKSKTMSTNGIAALGHMSVKNDDIESRHQIFQVAITDSIADAYVIPPVVAMALRSKYHCKILVKIVETIFRCTKAIIYFFIQYTPLGFIIHELTTTTMLFLMHPSSRGSVTISLKKDCSPRTRGRERRRDVTIQVNPKYLDDPQDLIDFKTAWDVSEKISSSSFEVFPRVIFSVLKLFRSEYFWFASYCRYFLLPYYHFSGTCAMTSGTSDINPFWVVDSSLKVRGHERLYICDASVFPDTISNPPALTCAALGYEFARYMLVDDNVIDMNVSHKKKLKKV